MHRHTDAGRYQIEGVEQQCSPRLSQCGILGLEKSGN